jgi:hypothetical protein
MNADTTSSGCSLVDVSRYIDYFLHEVSVAAVDYPCLNDTLQC